jgi:hypothetical protein
MTASIPSRSAHRTALVWLLFAVAAAPVCGAAQELSAPVWQERIEVAAGGGHRGPWRMNDSDWRFVDDPAVAIDERGVIGVAWADQARQDIFFQRYGPDGAPRLDAPVNVSRNPGIFSWLPRMLIRGEDASEVYILWQEIIFYPESSHGGDILFARSTDGGRTFSDALNLSSTPAGAGKGRLSADYWHNGSLDLAMGPDGTLYAVWTEYEGALRLSRSTDGGESFSAPLHIAGGATDWPARGPALAVGGDGVVYLAWTVGEDPAADIRLARSADGGRSFTQPAVIHESAGHADGPKLAVGPDGTLHVAYGESPEGPLRQYHVRYTRSHDGGMSFEAPRALARGETGHHSAHFPHLAVGNAGRVYLAWELLPDPRPRPLGLGFTYSADGGRSFAPPRVLPGSDDPALGINGSQQGMLMRKLAMNGAGAIAVVNSSFRANESSHIWLYRAHP